MPNRIVIPKPNGCGPQWMEKYLLLRLLRRFLFDWFFKASCKKHDEGYTKGGNEVRRFECDWKFMLAMWWDCKTVKWWFKPCAYPMAIIYFSLVRLLGWLIFNYSEDGVVHD